MFLVLHNCCRNDIHHTAFKNILALQLLNTHLIVNEKKIYTLLLSHQMSIYLIEPHTKKDNLILIILKLFQCVVKKKNL